MDMVRVESILLVELNSSRGGNNTMKVDQRRDDWRRQHR